jgi:para-aminobenzoate synthetase component 1
MLLQKPAQQVETLKQQALAWASQQEICTYFTPNGFDRYPHGPFRELLAAGFASSNDPKTSILTFEALKSHVQLAPSWLFGHIGYDMKNTLEALSSGHPAADGFPDMFFYEPLHVVAFHPHGIEILKSPDPHALLHTWEAMPESVDTVLFEGTVTPVTDKATYCKDVTSIKQHILEGDIYEMNYCMCFQGSFTQANPLGLFQQLNQNSPMPFAAFYRHGSHYLVCASPERFLKKEGSLLISQPIKGTAPRGHTPENDEALKNQLLHNEKERAENLMIVDLVRNDLARSCKTGSVTVEELFGIYSFSFVHQMISTVTGILENTHPIDALQYAFPMGSMTGAPKVKAMELIERYEKVRRGIFSGAVGYLSPEGDFDFNVVIRSLMLDTSTKKASFQVGSAITYDADPEKEHQECLLKAKALFSLVGQS